MLRIRWWHWVVPLGLAGLVCAGWLYWRYTAPVEVRLTATVGDLPFTVETIPPVVEARPGEVISVTYRIQNTDVLPLEAIGRIVVEPSAARDQIKIYLTQCGGLNTFQNGYPENYLVFFRVQPAGLTGAQQITLLHTFTRAAPPRS